MDPVQPVRVCKLHVVIHVIKYEDRDWLFDFSLIYRENTEMIY